MAKTDQKIRKSRVPLTPEARESQLESLAMDLAEEQLRNGTASAQVISHFLKLASQKTQLELEKLKKENDLLTAKTEAMQSAKRVEDLYENAINAMRSYSGSFDEEDGDIYENEY